MAASERTRLLLRTRQQKPFDFEGIDETNNDGETTSRPWVVVLVVISCLAVSSQFIGRGAGASSTSSRSTIRSSFGVSTTTTEAVPTSSTNVAVASSTTTRIASNTADRSPSSMSIDSLWDQWEEWKRIITPTNQRTPKAAFVHQHLELAQRVVDWEALESKVQSVWQKTNETAPALEHEAEQALEHEAEQAKQVWDTVKTLVIVIAKELGDKADEQWNTFMKSSTASFTGGMQEAHNAVKGEMQEAHNAWNSTVTEIAAKNWSLTGEVQEAPNALSGAHNALAGEMRQVHNALTGEVQEARNAWNSTLSTVENEHWWSDMSSWFQNTWIKYADDAHATWMQLQNKTTGEGQTLWNETVEQERVWYANALTNLYKLGNHMRAWWVNASGEAIQEETQIHDNFLQWWNSAQDWEREWWMQTRQAYSNFTRKAADQESLWWNIVHDSSQDFWNASVQTSEEAWTKAQSKALEGWNASEHGLLELEDQVKVVWNVAAQTEEQYRHVVERWFGAHATYAEELAQPLIYLNTTPAFGMLMNGYGWFDYSHDFFLYQQGWDAQINQAYCGVATAATVLNSLRSGAVMGGGDDENNVFLPVDEIYYPYHYATQAVLMNQKLSCINSNVVLQNSTFDGILHPPFGLSLHQAKELLLCYLPPEDFNVTIHYVDPDAMDIDQMRMELTQALRDPMSRVFIGFDRQSLGQEGGGHFSPLGSYYETEDRFLVLDVAKYKYPAVWVPAARLFASMATLDMCGNPDWDPSAQDLWPRKFNISNIKGPEDLAAKLHYMGCQQTYRGYIIVTRRPKGPTTEQR